MAEGGNHDNTGDWTVRDEDIVENMTPDVIKALRTNTKRAHTNHLKLIKRHIRDRGSRTVLRAHREQLARLLNELVEHHNHLSELLQLSEDRRLQADASYLLPVEQVTIEAYQRIDDYLYSRQEEPASTIKSSVSGLSAQMKQAKASKFETELKLKQAARKMEEELKEARRAAEIKRQVEEVAERMEEEKRKAEFRKEQRELIDLLERQKLEEKALNRQDYSSSSECSSRSSTSSRLSSPDRSRSSVSHRSRTYSVRDQHRSRSREKQTRANDDWIKSRGRSKHRDRSQTGMNPMITLLPKHEIAPFNGDPLEWPGFISAFKDLVHDVVTSDSQRLSMLRQLLTPEIRNDIVGTFHSPNTYWEALEQLRNNYGHPHIVARAHLNRLMSISSINEQDSGALASFSRQLRGTINVLQANGYGNELSSSIALGQMVKKLPRRLQSRWGQVTYERLPEMVTLIDLDRWLHKIAMGEMMLLETAPKTDQSKKSKTQNRQSAEKKKISSTPSTPTIFSTTSKSFTATTPASKCFACDAVGHGTQECQSFLALDVNAKARLVKEKGRCFRCLGGGHISRECPTKLRCKVDGCTGRHHTQLHGAERVSPPPPTEEKKVKFEESPGCKSTCTNVSNKTLLALVKIYVMANERTVETFALLDPGSEVTLIREDVAEQLQLSGPAPAGPECLGAYHGDGPKMTTKRVNFKIGAPSCPDLFDVTDALSVPHLNVSSRCVDWNAAQQRWPHLKSIKYPTDVGTVTVLIGMDVVEAHMQLEVRKPPKGVQGPYAVRFAFGWSLVGPTHWSAVKRASNEKPHVHSVCEIELHEMVKQFWKTDSLDTQPKSSLIGADEQRAIDIVNSTLRYLGDSYECGLTWRNDEIHLPDNFIAALNRLYALERKFRRDPEYAKRYAVVVDEYIRKGYAVKLSEDEINLPKTGREWYLPHHGVTHPQKPDQVRIVLDCSAEFEGVSLNNMLLKGPNLLVESSHVITSFRLRRIPVSADIEKMFFQVGVLSPDQAALRFLWRQPGCTHPPDVFRMPVQVFGAVSSPFICSFVLRRTAEDFREQFSSVADKVATNFYVDNYLDSFDTEEEATEACKKLAELLSRGGFRLTKWLSSSRAVLASLPAADLMVSNLDLDLDRLPVERTLGILWDCETDTFCFKTHIPKEATTKRKILSAVSSIYDPLGFLAPIILTPKRLLQEIWRDGTDWDEPINERLLHQWNRWVEELPTIENLSIPRSFAQAEFTRFDLHVFADASENGFGAVLYIRFPVGNNCFGTAFVAAKTRVAPVKQLSIPRLELQGALIAFRLASSFVQVLKTNVSCVTFWSDSQTVIQWISSRKCRFHNFVANRVGEIREGSDAAQWRHVPGRDNPADDCSRGVSPIELTNQHRWFVGPNFLTQDESLWPPLKQHEEPSTDDQEVSEPRWVGSLAVPETNRVSDTIRKAPSLWSLKRRIGYLLRFVANCAPKTTPKFSYKWLTVPELKRSLELCIRVTQRESFPDEIHKLEQGRTVHLSSSIVKLTPFLDRFGVLRVGGRLSRSEMAFDTVHPVILPTKHRLTELIIEELHLRFFHASTERLLSELRSCYWVIRGRQAIKRIIYSCPTCMRKRSQPQIPLMAALPPERLKPFQPPFTSVGIDYFGPLYTVIGRRTEKRYGCLFTCLTTRAVHLEVAHSLSTDSFLMCFRRFVARRGTPVNCFSDNGTNLTAGEKELRECLQSWNLEKIDGAMAQRSINWKFSPPSGPHFGGVWERLVKSAKDALRLVFADRTVSDEVLNTVIVEVEWLLNGRPLTHVSVDPTDPEALTPNHFLLGRAHPNLPPDVLQPSATVSKRSWKEAQVIVEHFWRRWLREYVPQLIERRKWLFPRRNLQLNDIVLLVEPNSPRGHWPIGRVVSPISGPDGVVRAARVRTKTGEYVRPVAKICLLEENNEDLCSANV